MHFYYDDDADLTLLDGKTVSIIGYGNQGRAQALNLKDSGVNVIMGLRTGSPSITAAEQEGLRVEPVEKAAEAGDFIVMLTPDEQMPDLFKQAVLPGLKPGNILGFAHGFNILYGGIEPPDFIDVVLNSPKCIGYLVRENFVKGSGFPNLIAVHQDYSGNAKQFALAYAKGIGGTRTGVMDSTVKEETVTNLFAEQTVLCGGIAELIKAGFDTLVEAGYSHEVAFFECMHEIKPIIDLFYREGLAEMNRRISNTAEYGEYVSGPRVISEESRNAMRAVLKDIESGEFAENWMRENREGSTEFMRLREKSASHPIEIVGGRMRKMMPWLKAENGK